MAEEKNKSIRELRQKQRRMKAKQEQAEFMTIKNAEQLARKFGAPASEIAALKKARDVSGMEKLARQYISMGTERSGPPELLEDYEFLLRDPTKFPLKRKPSREKGIGRVTTGKGATGKPKMMKGGMYKGKSHSYAAGGMVKELKM